MNPAARKCASIISSAPVFVILVGAMLGLASLECSQPEALRHEQVLTGAAGTGAAGTTGVAGDSSGLAGDNGAAGTTGAAGDNGTGVAGTGAIDASGAAGTTGAAG